MNKLDPWYQSILQQVIDEGVTKSDRTGTGTKSIFGVQFKHDMRDGFPILTTKKVHFKSVVTELLWFLRGDTNIKYLLDNDCNIWNGDAYKNYTTKLLENYSKHYEPIEIKEFIERIKTDDAFANEYGELGPIYGAQWRNFGGNPLWKGMDQIEILISELKSNPDSRRLMISAWNPLYLDKMVLPPCHYGFQVYTRELTGKEKWDLLKQKVGEEKFNTMVDDLVPFGIGLSEELQLLNIPTRAISLMWNQRSVDTFLGLPFNISSYGLLLEILAKIANMIPDQLIGNLGDVHLYNNHIEQAKEQIGRTSFDLPTINFNPIFLANLEHKGLDEAINDQINIQLENYQSHLSIKAPLSN